MFNYPDIQAFADQLQAARKDSDRIIAGLSEEQGAWRPQPRMWSVAECIDHIALTNMGYLAAMRPAALRAQAKGRRRRGSAAPGWFGRFFASKLEPPVAPKHKWKAPLSIQPNSSSLAHAVAEFRNSHQQVQDFLGSYFELDLTGTSFQNPFIPFLRFSLASGINNILAHQRRHLWQAWNVRRTANIPDPA